MSAADGDDESGGSVAEAGAGQGGARPGLLLFVPAEIEPERLRAALSAGGIVGVVIEPADPRAPALRALCRAATVACLIADDAAGALRLDADGVHLEATGDVPKARGELGDRAIIGVTVGLSHHAAMVAGEDGADYVMAAAAPGAPGAALDLADFCTWWSELFVLPCAVDVRGHDGRPAELVAAGADFISVQEAVWNGGPDPAAAVRGLLEDMERARVEQQVAS